MRQMRKITVTIPAELLASAQAYTGDGVAATVRAGLQRLVSIRAQHEALKLRGKVNLSLTLDELRHDRR